MKKLFLLLVMLSGSIVAMQSEVYDTVDGSCTYVCNEKDEITRIHIYSTNDTGSLTRVACRQSDGTWIQTSILNGKIEKQETLSSRPDLPPRKKYASKTKEIIKLLSDEFK